MREYPIPLDQQFSKQTWKNIPFDFFTSKEVTRDHYFSKKLQNNIK